MSRGRLARAWAALSKVCHAIVRALACLLLGWTGVLFYRLTCCGHASALLCVRRRRFYAGRCGATRDGTSHVAPAERLPGAELRPQRLQRQFPLELRAFILGARLRGGRAVAQQARQHDQGDGQRAPLHNPACAIHAQPCEGLGGREALTLLGGEHIAGQEPHIGEGHDQHAVAHSEPVAAGMDRRGQLRRTRDELRIYPCRLTDGPGVEEPRLRGQQCAARQQIHQGDAQAHRQQWPTHDDQQLLAPPQEARDGREHGKLAPVIHAASPGVAGPR